MTAPGLVLFDLDGTLVDTAVELIDCVEDLCSEEARPPPARAALRAAVSHGAGALVQQTWSVAAGSARADALERALVRRYEACIGTRAPLFDGMETALAALEARAIPWGVFTNKPGFLARPLLNRLGLDRRAALVLCGDDLPHAKPHPCGIQQAARTFGIPTRHCVMLGDAVRDIEAATRAGAPALVALFGYLHAGDRVTAWGAHGLLGHPGELLPWVDAFIGGGAGAAPADGAA